MRRLFRLFLLPFVCLIASSAATPLVADNGYVFTQIGLYQGMPSRVNFVYEEHNGMIWLAMPEGLMRYDGRKLKSYDLLPESGGPTDPSGPKPQVLQILEDNRHRLYVLTNRGLMHYSRHEDRFRSIERADRRPIDAGAMCPVDDGLLLGGTDTLYKYSYDTDRITVFRPLGTEGFRPQRMVLRGTHELVCSNRSDRLLFLDLTSGERRFVTLSKQNKVADICVGPDGYFWVADYNDGIKRIARNGEVLDRFTTRNSALSCDVALCVAAIDGKIWVGTDGGGINIIDPASGQIEILRHETDNANSLPVNTILWMHGSLRQNGVWVTTARRGLINIRRTGMQTFQNVPTGYPHGLTEKTVLSLFEEPGGGTIWIGTDGGGINRLQTASHTFTHYPDTRNDKVVSICAFSPDKLFVSIFAQGFYLFDKRTGRKEPHPLDAPELNRFIRYSGIPANLLNESDGDILLLAQPPMRYRTVSGRLESIEPDSSAGIVGMLSPIGKDRHYSYLYDTRSIYRLPFGGHRLECLYRSPTPEFINAAYRDDNGVFWIVGASGLYRFDGSEPSRIDNAPFDGASSVLRDHKGRVWVGTRHDVVSYLPDEQRFMLYGEADGALKNEFLAKPVLLTSEDEVYLGGANGLLCIDARLEPSRPADADRREVILTDLQIADVNAMAQLDDGRITVPGNSRNIKLGFLVSGDDLLRPRLFRYLLGRDLHDAIVTPDADLTIPTLAAGTYPIHVTYTRKDGSWSQPQQVLTLVVLPPWYKSWWFVTLVALFFVGLICLGVIALLRRKDDRHRWMLSQQEHRINEEKVRFLINISHELRTPLTLIYAPLKKIVGAIRPSNPLYKQLATAFRQSQRMKALIDMVLDVRKMEEGMDRPELRDHPFNDWVREVCDDFTDEDGNALIECRFDPQIGEVAFDAQKCRTALTNLIINAIKHNSKGGGSVNVTTTLSTDGASVRVSVTDHGPGLRGVDPSKLFTRFYQGDNEQTGSGLGLSYAKLLIDLHHGRVGAFDNPSGGATFYFELPLRPPSSQPSASDRKPASYLNELLAPLSHQDIEIPESRHSEQFDLRPYTVLLVDDNPELIDYLVEELRPRFRRVLTAADGETAYRLACEEQPDIIVSDVMMPDMNGYELCKAIRENLEVSHIPIILLTARNDDESRKYGYRLGADSYLSKPFELEQLLDKIRSRLYNRLQTRRHYQRINATTTQHTAEDDLTSADTSFMKRLHQAVVENLDNPRLDIPLLCTLLGMSRASIYNKLKAITGMGANDYINKIRIEQAMRLLRDGSMNITEISERVGFTSPKYFSTSFKQYTGKTPSQYKKEGR